MAVCTFLLPIACASPSWDTQHPSPEHSAVQVLDAAQLESLTRDRVVVMDFWATWCKPCLDELPTLHRVHERYAPAGVVVLGVHVGGDVGEVQGFVRDAAIRYPVVVDEDFIYSRSRRADRVPTIVLLDARGQEVSRAAVVDGPLLAHLERLLEPAS